MKEEEKIDYQNICSTLSHFDDKYAAAFLKNKHSHSCVYFFMLFSVGFTISNNNKQQARQEQRIVAEISKIFATRSQMMFGHSVLWMKNEANVGSYFSLLLSIIAKLPGPPETLFIYGSNQLLAICYFQSKESETAHQNIKLCFSGKHDTLLFYMSNTWTTMMMNRKEAEEEGGCLWLNTLLTKH